jgi:hypothetical protein
MSAAKVSHKGAGTPMSGSFTRMTQANADDTSVPSVQVVTVAQHGGEVKSCDSDDDGALISSLSPHSQPPLESIHSLTSDITFAEFQCFDSEESNEPVESHAQATLSHAFVPSPPRHTKSRSPDEEDDQIQIFRVLSLEKQSCDSFRHSGCGEGQGHHKRSNGCVATELLPKKNSSTTESSSKSLRNATTAGTQSPPARQLVSHNGEEFEELPLLPSSNSFHTSSGGGRLLPHQPQRLLVPAKSRLLTGEHSDQHSGTVAMATSPETGGLQGSPNNSMRRATAKPITTPARDAQRHLPAMMKPGPPSSVVSSNPIKATMFTPSPIHSTSGKALNPLNSSLSSRGSSTSSRHQPTSPATSLSIQRPLPTTTSSSNMIFVPSNSHCDHSRSTSCSGRHGNPATLTSHGKPQRYSPHASSTWEGPKCDAFVDEWMALSQKTSTSAPHPPTSSSSTHLLRGNSAQAMATAHGNAQLAAHQSKSKSDSEKLLVQHQVNLDKLRGKSSHRLESAKK